MSEWAVQFEPNDTASAATLRGVPDVRACVDDGCVWVRVPAGEQSDSIVVTLRGRRFRVLEDGQLVAAHERVPGAWLPNGPWQPVDEFINVEVPVARFAVPPATRVSLSLTRSTSETMANAMLTDIRSWHAFIDMAPQVRIDCLRFAISSDERVFVLGEPLPSLPGTRLSVTSGIAVPCGLTWSPTVDAETVRRVFNVDHDAMVLWTATDEWEVISSDSIVRASRSAVRAMQTMGDAEADS